MSNWHLIVTLIVLWISVCVDSRFRRLSSGLFGSSSIPSGGWRLIKENDYHGPNNQYNGLSPLTVSSSSLSSGLPSTLLFNSQRHQTINPTIHTNHWRLPFQRHGYKELDSSEDELESPIVNNNNNNNNNNQGDNLDQSLRLNHHHQGLLTESGKLEHEPAEKVLEQQHQVNHSSSDESSNVPKPKSEKVILIPGSPESLLGEEIASRSLSSSSIHYANKKAESESVQVHSSPLIQYRTLGHGSKHPGASSFSDLYFVAIVVGSSGLAIFSVIGAGYCFYRFQQHNKSAADVDYPAYGVVGPITKETTNSGNISPIGDRKLAQSAQMYHYHHQKQQMIASEKGATSRHTSASDVDSEEENEEGDYTVYECPGLASTGEMEVKNPLFQDDITPVSSPSIVTNGGDSKDKK